MTITFLEKGEFCFSVCFSSFLFWQGGAPQTQNSFIAWCSQMLWLNFVITPLLELTESSALNWLRSFVDSYELGDHKKDWYLEPIEE
jgi:hypothetical protein